ncbi:unc-93 [Cordylochernes scorpioides]|uniref:Unc-93 n=1 Tax=Cordylochernes scorpioides TaxID=51811 RepID=A0ABY6KDY8_9ARAC|nr:unc-93 [Cordylochernes scorpioides]
MAEVIRVENIFTNDRPDGCPMVLSTCRQDKHTPRHQKLVIYKNLAVISTSFLLLFTAFQSLSNLQSSLNSEAGLGTASLAVIYGALVLSCLFVPSFAIRHMGLKMTLVISMLLYGTYFAANLYAKWWTLIPASVLLGTAGAPLWTAKCAYLTQLAGRYAELNGDRHDLVLASFFGVFFMIFQSGQVWGNLISYYVLM